MYATAVSHTKRYRTTQKNPTAGKERLRLAQFAVCLVLFLVVFLGKGAFPNQMQQVGQLLAANLDVSGLVLELGERISEQNGTLAQVGDFCMEVLGLEKQAQLPAQLAQEQQFLNQTTTLSEQVEHYLKQEIPQERLEQGQAVAVALDTQEQTPQIQQEPAVPPVGTVVTSANYTGLALPENYTMDELSIGTLDTVTPVMGHLWSTYGYRDHPVDGEYKFHNGVDLGASEGEDIGAFASGTVDYIGENDTHGLYLQLDHGNGIKSFYAHCSKLCVSQGQMVTKGEKVAEVGSTGVSTGPHLHLELKVNGIHVNPAYYIEYISVS